MNLMNLIFILMGAALVAVSAEGSKASELQVVSNVDLNRYVGKWYEIGRLPNRFQKKCAGDVTANYTLLSDGKIQVVNRCRKSSGQFTEAKGTAKIADKKTNAKLKVTFFWPFYGDYWILDLGRDYEYAVVGDPKRKYLWILSRTPQMDEGRYRELLARMAERGFETERMIKTAQGG